MPSPSRELAARRLLPVALALFACAAAGRAQQQTPTPTPTPPEDVITVESNLVQLNVGVVDPQGRPITSLGQNDFAVYEDGVKQTIRSFEPTQSPFSLVLLLDLSGSTLSFRTQLRMAALRFVDALGPQDRVSIVAFWAQRRVKEPRVVNHVETLADFTSDRRKIFFTLQEGIPNGSGDTNLYEALRSSLGALAREGKRRKAIVVLTDGVDSLLSGEDRAATINAKTGDEAVAALKPDASALLNEVLNTADRLGVTIYPLALPSGDLKRLLDYNRQMRGKEPRDPAFDDPTPQQVAVYTAARARLDRLAARTGGRLYVINRLEDLARQYAEVAAEMRTLYSIAYQSANATARDGKWREIRIEVSRPDTVARTRPGYFAR
ncbi:MAG TPA: VWA domain-containing protein [Pyrinomonadaceae bacterium]|jgi:VWFA-related protein